MVTNPGELWAAADLTERHRLLLMLPDAVFVDARDTRGVVSIRPKAAFEAVLAGASAIQSERLA